MSSHYPTRDVGTTLQPLQSDGEFQHATLTGPNHIRLAYVLPGTDVEPLSISLGEYILNDKIIPYTAISYVWGDSAEMTSVVCCGKLLNISTNLSSALKIFQNAKLTYAFWADAICINQEDFAERNAQVRIMSRIYSSAVQVIIWLGDAAEDTPLAFETLRAFSKLQEDIAKSDQKRELKQEDKHHWSHVEDMSSMNSPGLRAFRNLLKRPWFERTWIWQEVAFSKRAILYCGRNAEIWDKFSNAFNYMVRIEPLYGIEVNQIVTYLSATRFCIAKQFNPTSTLRLSKLLGRARNSKATDPRDKVFALLGMARQTGELHADYRKSLVQVYCETVRILIEVDDSLQILQGVQNSDNKHGLPSWVPDWSEPWCNYNPLSHRWDPEFTPRYNASGGLKYQIREQKLPTKLEIAGMRVDQICALHNPRHEFTELDRQKDVWSSVISHFTAVANSYGLFGSYKFTDQPYGLAYYLTLWADQLPSGKRSNKLLDVISFQGYKSCSLEGTLEEVDICMPKPSVLKKSLVMWNVARCRRFFITNRGYIGLAPENSMVGDWLTILSGGEVFYCLRRNTDGYKFIGECYAHGIMDGEGIKLALEAGSQLEFLLLV